LKFHASERGKSHAPKGIAYASHSRHTQGAIR
jgi:hypothetical protein